MLSALAGKDQARFEKAVERQIDGGKTDYRRVFSAQSILPSGSGEVSAIRSKPVSRLGQGKIKHRG
jgi:hypothetical protein